MATTVKTITRAEVSFWWHHFFIHEEFYYGEIITDDNSELEYTHFVTNGNVHDKKLSVYFHIGTPQQTQKWVFVGDKQHPYGVLGKAYWKKRAVYEMVDQLTKEETFDSVLTEVKLTAADFALNRISVKDFVIEDDYDGHIERIDGIPKRFSMDWYMTSSDSLTRIADHLRHRRGMLPILSDSSYLHGMCDYDGWYNFYFAVLGDISESGAITNINYEVYFTVNSNFAIDNGKCYHLVLSNDVLNQVVSQLEETNNLDFSSLLNEVYSECSEY